MASVDSVSTSPSTSEPASVRPVACLRCRQRRSYCSKDRPKCTRCRDGGYECIYEEARKITVNETYLRDLEAKARAYDEHNPTRQRHRDTPVQPRTRTLDEDEEFEEDEHPLLEPFTQLNVDLPGRPSTSFKGPGSSDNFLRSVRKLSGLYGVDDGLDLNPNFYEPGALPSRRITLRTQVRLPPLDIARRLFAAQYTYIGTIFFFTDPNTFEELLHEAYRGPPDPDDRDACLRYAKVLAILAFGQLYSVNQWIDFKGPPGFEYFVYALQLLPDAHEEAAGSMLCVETLAYVGYFLQNMNRRDAAFLYIGMALRMAISLGIHQEVSVAHPGLDERAREHRRRVWWSIYSLDRILCVKSGNPVTIQDEDIGVAMPSKLPHEPDYCPAVVLRHYTQISRILGRLSGSIYRRAPKSGSRLMASVQTIIKSLSQWQRDLPDELRFDPAKLSISRESVSTLLHYYQCINMTARPLLFQVVKRRLESITGGGVYDASSLEVTARRQAEKQRDWKEGLSPSTIKVIEMCVNAAQDTVNVMTIAAQRDLVATYGFMDGEHIFSAAIVLVMVCVAFPANPKNTLAMNAGLEVLRGMAQRGNSHMGARCELLDHLRSMILPAPEPLNVSSPPPLVHYPTRLSGASSIPHGPVAPVATGTSTASPQPPTAPHGSGGGETFGVPMADLDTVAASGGSALELGSGLSGNELAQFPLMDNAALDGMLYDVDMMTVTSDPDFGLWEEGFANPAGDAGYVLTQWTQQGGMGM